MNKDIKIPECLVCERISPRYVFESVYSIFVKSPKLKKHEIAKRACETINQIDKKHRIFFCGKTKARMLSGLLYLLGLIMDYRNSATQGIVSKALKMSQPTVRASYKYWLKCHPEVFSEIKNPKTFNPLFISTDMKINLSEREFAIWYNYGRISYEI